MKPLLFFFMALILILASSPARAHPGFTDKRGCHTNRQGEYHCHETANLAAAALGAALIRAKERAPATYAAMDQALIRASGRAPGAYKAMRKARPKAAPVPVHEKGKPQ